MRRGASEVLFGCWVDPLTGDEKSLTIHPDRVQVAGVTRSRPSTIHRDAVPSGAAAFVSMTRYRSTSPKTSIVNLSPVTRRPRSVNMHALASLRWAVRAARDVDPPPGSEVPPTHTRHTRMMRRNVRAAARTGSTLRRIVRTTGHAGSRLRRIGLANRCPVGNPGRQPQAAAPGGSVTRPGDVCALRSCGSPTESQPAVSTLAP